MSTAARTAGFGKRRLPGQSGVSAVSVPIGTGPVAGPDDPIGLKVEIFISSAWTDISPFVYYKNRIKITRGRADETSQVSPQSATMTINNRDGRFSPRNPVGPYYGQIGRNTPLRVSRLQNGIRRYRFVGEVPAWPTTWDISGTDVWVTITASGSLRRVSQGDLPFRSPMYRALGLPLNSGFVVVNPVAYWPCEDGANSTSIASGLPGGAPLALTGQALPTFASDSSFPGSQPLPLLAGSIWTGTIPAATGNVNTLAFAMSVPLTGAFDTAVLARLYTTGTVARLDLQYGAASGGSLALTGYDATGVQLFTSGYKSPTEFLGAGFTGFNGLPVIITVALGPLSPGTITWEVDFSSLLPLTPLNTSFGLSFGTMSGSLGTATRMVINPDGHINDTAIGHVSYQTKYIGVGSVISLPLNAWIGEYPAAPLVVFGTLASAGRFLRLCQEQGVQGTVVYATGINSGDPTTMGYQPIDTFANLIQEPVATSAGLMFEARDQLSLVLRERNSLYNQAAKLTLDYSLNQLSGPLDPVDDDALTRNDVTVSRVGGSSAQQTLTTGALSTAPPPAGVGDYATSYNISLGADAQLPDAAGWRLHLGTVDEPRYPNITVNLRHPTFTSNLDMMNAALTIDIGDRLAIVNPPPWMPPDQISLIVQGYTETLGIWEHDVVFNCSPESPWRVGIADDPVLGRADTDGSTLALPAAADATSLSVATTNVASPRWTTAAADFPLDVVAGGERITVTVITSPPTIGGADGTFETGVALWVPFWSPTAGTWAQSSAQAHTGTKSGLISTVTNLSTMTVTTPFFPVSPNTAYTISFWVMMLSGTGTIFGQLTWYDARFTNLGTGTATGTANSPGAWTTEFSTATSPVNAAYATFTIVDNVGTAHGLFIDDVTVSPPPDPQLFTVTRAANAPTIALGADGTFETGVTGWVPSAGTFVSSTALVHSGSRSGLLTVTGSPSQTIARTPNIPVVGGTGYSLFAWLANASGTPSVLTAIDWYDSGNSYITTSFSPSQTAPAAFTQVSFTATAPSNAAFGQVGPSIVFSPAAGNAIYVDDVTLTAVMKAQTAGTDVRLSQPMILSL